MQEDGFDAASDYVRVGVKAEVARFVLWFKIWQVQRRGRQDICWQWYYNCSRKNLFLYLRGTILEFSGGLNGKGFVFNNPNGKELVAVESHFHFSLTFKAKM